MAKKSISKKILHIFSSPANISRAFLSFVMISDLVIKFFNPKVGQAYQIKFGDKLNLIKKMMLIDKKIPTGTNWIDSLLMAIYILNISPKIKGDLVECGAWKGASSARLSLLAKLVKRKLIVADSFEGLPADQKVVHQYPHLGVFGFYKKGMYKTELDEVKENISKYGEIKSCDFLVGFYQNSLKKIKKSIVFVFLDVDLASSTKDCLKYLWPKLIDGGFVFTDDSCDMAVVKVWFDQSFWKISLKQSPPGYVGSGCGLPTVAGYSALGYARKVIDPKKSYNKIFWLSYT